MDLEALKAIKPLYMAYSACRLLRFRVNLAVAKLHDRKDRRNPAYVPLPPAELRHRVHGSLDPVSFLQVGRAVAQNLHDLCTSVGRDIYSFQNVLDFGCGCGRVLRNFQDAPESCRLYGTDIDPGLVSWCEENLPRVRCSTNGFQPPLPYADKTFDLIYAISVFTHLDEQPQQAWLKELHRVARPGAILILSVHGEPLIQGLSPSLRSRVRSHGFLFVKRATGRLKLDKLPDSYQHSFQTREYIFREWSTYFDVVRYIERGINSTQDAVLLRQRVTEAA